MKAAVQKCVELRTSTADYLLHIPDLDPELEKPDDAGEEENVVHDEQLDLNCLLRDNIECKRQLQHTRAQWGDLVTQMTNLTAAVGALRITQPAAPLPPVSAHSSVPLATSSPLITSATPIVNTTSVSGLPSSAPPLLPQGAQGGGVPAGLGVLKPLWSTASVSQPWNSTNTGQMLGQAGSSAVPVIIPPMNPGSISASKGWPGWGQQQGTPGQVGVPLVPPTLLPQSLLHQDWFGDSKPESKSKRSKHWMRPDFYIPSEKRYDELSYRELMFGMVSVAQCMARYNIPTYPVLNYLEHMKYVAMKGMSASFTPESLSKYEYLVTSKVLAGQLPVHVPAEHESVYTYLSAENTVAFKAAATPAAKKASKPIQPWFRCPKDVCLKWNQERCDRQDCDRKHICASCRQDHTIKKCGDSAKKA